MAGVIARWSHTEKVCKGMFAHFFVEQKSPAIQFRTKMMNGKAVRFRFQIRWPPPNKPTRKHQNLTYFVFVRQWTLGGEYHIYVDRDTIEYHIDACLLRHDPKERLPQELTKQSQTPLWLAAWGGGTQHPWALLPGVQSWLVWCVPQDTAHMPTHLCHALVTEGLLL